MTDQFKNQLEADCIDCFKNNLKQGIYNHSLDKNVFDDVITEAVASKKRLENVTSKRDNASFLNKKKDILLFPDDTVAIKCQICEALNHTAKNCTNIYSIFKTCNRCKKPGHLARECTMQNSGFGFNKICNICKKNNHSTRNCFFNKCNICRKQGHTTDRCRSNNNYNNCQICKKYGHQADACRLRNNFGNQQNNQRKTCNYRKKPGHTENVCFSKQKNASARRGTSATRVAALTTEMHLQEQSHETK